MRSGFIDYAHGIADREKTRKLKVEHREVEGVDYYEPFASTVSGTSHRSMAAMVCRLDGDLRRLDFRFSSSRTWTSISTCACPPVVGR